MEKERRLRRKSEFLQAQRQGKSWAHPLLILRALPSDQELSRFGFLVSGRIGKAVERNKVKRRLREIVRREPVKNGWDVVFIARSAIVQATFQEMQAAVRDLLQRGRFLETVENLPKATNQ